MTTYSPAHAAAALELDGPAEKAYLANDWAKYSELKLKQADLFDQAGLADSAKIARNAAKEVASLVK